MHRIGLGLAAAILLVGFTWSLFQGEQVPIRLLSGNLVSLAHVQPAQSMVRDLGLPGADTLQVLEQADASFLLLYPEDADPVETAAQWSVALAEVGLAKTADWSRPGRTILLLQHGELSALLAVGRTSRGPFVFYASPAPMHHWALGPDTEAPALLRPLLPPPSPT